MNTSPSSRTFSRMVLPRSSSLRWLLVVVSGLMLAACNGRGARITESAVSTDTIPVPEVTMLADLADSSKPAEILIESLSPPKRFPVRSSKANSSFSDTSLFPPNRSQAQGKGLFTTYTTDDGIGLDEVYCSFTDSSGILWFGTNGGGISRYDGKSFTSYTTANGLAYNLIWCITQDRHNNLWIGTDGGGVSKYDGKVFTNYTTSQGLAHNVVYSITEDRSGNLWFGTSGGGISKFDGKGFKTYDTTNGLASNRVSDITEDGSGNLWISTRGGGITKFNGTSFVHYTEKEGLAGNIVRTGLKDRAGNLWFGTTGGGLSKYDGTAFTNYSVADGLADNTVWNISQDRSGNLWVGTEKGVSKYDGRSFVNYTIQQGIANNKVTSIAEDAKGDIWFTTFGGGVSKFGGSSITNFTTMQGLASNVVYSIVEDSTGSLWFATNGGGVVKYDGHRFLNYTAEDGLVNNTVYSILKDRNANLWFGSFRHGISKFDGKSFTNYAKEQGLPNNTVFRMIEDKAGNLWMGTSGGGVSKFDGRSFTNYTTAQGLANNVVFSMLEDSKGNLWFGTLGGGVSKFDGKSFTNFTTAQGLADNGIWAITEDSAGDLWFGTQKGLNLLRQASQDAFNESIKNKTVFTKPLFELFTTSDGLPHEFVSQVLVVDKNRLFVGTNLGFSELLSNEPKNGEVRKWVVGKTYNTKTGFPIKDINSGPGAMFRDSKGIIWMGTGSDKTGLVRFDPRAANSNDLRPPKLLIRQVKIDNETISWSDLWARQSLGNADSLMADQIKSEEMTSFGRLLAEAERDSMARHFRHIKFQSINKWWPVPEGLVLPYEHNNISFDFNAIETGKNFMVHYQYQLEGYDKQWNNPTNVASASYGNVYEGKYRFLLRARNPEGVWSETLAYSFKVLPPWWRTWWAYGIYLLAFLGALRMYSKYREQKLRGEKERLEGQVQQRTQMLEDTIVTLKNTQSQLVHAEKMASLGELTAGIAHEIQNPLNFVNNFSEINKDLLGEMDQEIEKGNIHEVKDLARDLLENTERITQHGKRADAIVKSMLQHSRTSPGRRESTDINKLAEEFLKLSHHVVAGEQNHIQIVTDTSFDPAIQPIEVVPQEIGRVIVNLLNNAFWAVSEKYKSSSPGYIPRVSVSTKSLGDKIELRVRDNGMGIPAKTREKIFQPFFTTKPSGQGTGLGLSLSYDIIVKAHRGSLAVDSVEGEYTEFVVTLPVK